MSRLKAMGTHFAHRVDKVFVVSSSFALFLPLPLPLSLSLSLFLEKKEEKYRRKYLTAV